LYLDLLTNYSYLIFLARELSSSLPLIKAFASLRVSSELFLLRYFFMYAVFKELSPTVRSSTFYLSALGAKLAPSIIRIIYIKRKFRKINLT